MRLSLIHIYRPICTRNAYICPPPAVHAGRRKETSLLCVQTTHDAKIIKLADFQDLYAVRSLELVGVCAFDALPPLIPCRAKADCRQNRKVCWSALFPISFRRRAMWNATSRVLLSYQTIISWQGKCLTTSLLRSPFDSQASINRCV